MRELSSFLRQRKAAGAQVFPPGPQIFAAFDATPFEQVKVVILGQDPYHGAGQAHGLCFSVHARRAGAAVAAQHLQGTARPTSASPRPDHGCLLPWARQGVLLLNAVLTVEDGQAGAHQGKGWEGFTDHVVDALNREREGLVFMLWGSYAQAKGKVIDTGRHRVLKAPHPSPLSAHRGFLGCRHFSMANDVPAAPRPDRRSTGRCRRARRCNPRWPRPTAVTRDHHAATIILIGQHFHDRARHLAFARAACVAAARESRFPGRCVPPPPAPAPGAAVRRHRRDGRDRARWPTIQNGLASQLRRRQDVARSGMCRLPVPTAPRRYGARRSPTPTVSGTGQPLIGPAGFCRTSPAFTAPFPC